MEMFQTNRFGELEKYNGNERDVQLTELDSTTICKNAFAGKQVASLTVSENLAGFFRMCESPLSGLRHLKTITFQCTGHVHGAIDIYLYRLTRVFPELERVVLKGESCKNRFHLVTKDLEEITAQVIVYTDIRDPEEVNRALLTLALFPKLTLVPDERVFPYLPFDGKLAMASSFLRHPELFRENDMYCTFFRTNGIKIFKTELNNGRTETLLQLLARKEFRGFTHAAYDRLLAISDEKKMVEVRAALLDSCNHFFDAEKVRAEKDKRSMKRIMDPYHADNMSPIWSWTANATGLRLNRHKPSATDDSFENYEPEVIVPPRIGNKPVTELGCPFMSNHYARICIPDSVTKLGNDIFNGTTVDRLELPDSLEALPVRAFASGDALSIHFPAHLKHIGDNAFYDGIYRDSVLPPEVESIGEGAFSWCNVRSLAIHDRVTSIGRNAFTRSNLVSVRLPLGLYRIPDSCFRDCYDLTEVCLPACCSVIGAEAFLGCRKLQTIQIPDTVRYIEQSAFAESALTSFDGPQVLSVGEYAFQACANLRDVRLDNVVCLNQNVFFNSHVESVSAIRLPVLQEYAFCECGNLAEADFATATVIGAGAFRNCVSLGRLALGNLESVDPSAFAGCDSLKEITFPVGTDLERMHGLLDPLVPASVVLRIR